MNTPVLEVTNLSKNFGGLRALNEVDLTINRQEIVALIGPNGAGKTTFFNCITGIYLPTEGTVQLHLPERNGKPASSTTLNGMKPNEITSLGMARTFQNIRLFPTMTVLENVMIGRHCRTSAGIAGAVFQDSRTKAEEQATIDRSYELLREVGLNMHYRDEARNLPYGAQRRLEIARALATDPAVLLLDEPAAGMNPQETLELKSLILHLRKEFDLSILLFGHGHVPFGSHLRHGIRLPNRHGHAAGSAREPPRHQGVSWRVRPCLSFATSTPSTATSRPSGT